ncbi:recombinase family protein [Niallia sp. NCCP-28]|uniref:recombinase family protein n=1 Tax=Niallia sp. NCCP-28 TaxID=2934712 RepID=UPI00208D819E|nr:recombinase family protein [Niallia sp. NCCP-28]GKU81309.1 DNA invertase Pin [Niallia sp. NCCP-28]
MLIKTVAIYNRISRDNGESDDVLLNHRTITTRLCDSRKYQYKLYEEIESGGKFEERKQLLQLLKDIQQGLYDGLVVVELSRIARDNLYSQMIAKVLEDNEVPIITPNKIYNLSDEDDKFVFDMESMISSKELRTITRRMKNGKIEGARRGEWIQGVPPLGYTRGKDKKLVIVESEADIIRQIFNYAESGYGIPSIVKKLVGFKTKTEKQFTDTAVYTILKNKTYTGSIIYNVKGKKGNITETIENKHAHEAIITKEQFISVQQAIKSRMSGDLETRNRSRGMVLSTLKDLVYCTRCKSKMGFKKDSKQANRIYLKACKCGNRGVSETALLDAFQKKFRFLERFYRDEWQKALETTEPVSKDSLLQRIEDLKKMQEKLNKNLVKIRSAYIEEVFTKEEYLSEKSNTEEKLNQVLSTIDDLLDQINSLDKESITSQYKSKLEKIRQINDIYNKEVSYNDMVEVNRLLKLMLDKVYYKRLSEKVTGINPSRKGLKVEQVDFIQILIASKDIHK